MLKRLIWTIICLPVVAAIVDLTLGILAEGRTERGKEALYMGSAVVSWLKAPATLLFLHQLVLKGIRTMPPPPEDCTFWCRWFYDMAQTYGENPDLKGKVAPPKPTTL